MGFPVQGCKQVKTTTVFGLVFFTVPNPNLNRQKKKKGQNQFQNTQTSTDATETACPQSPSETASINYVMKHPPLLFLLLFH